MSRTLAWNCSRAGKPEWASAILYTTAHLVQLGTGSRILQDLCFKGPLHSTQWETRVDPENPSAVSPGTCMVASVSPFQPNQDSPMLETRVSLKETVSLDPSEVPGKTPPSGLAV